MTTWAWPVYKYIPTDDAVGGKATTKDMSEAIQSEVKRLLSV